MLLKKPGKYSEKKSVFVFLKDDEKEAWQIMIEDPVNICEKKKRSSKARILKKKA